MASNAGERRRFFRHLARETVVWLEEVRGRPHRRLSELAKLPPEALAGLIPQVCPGVEILPEPAQVRARVPGRTEPVTLFSAEEVDLFVFNRINGMNALGQIATELSAAMAWSEQESFAHVRALFLRLARLQVCVPCNAVPDLPAQAPLGSPGQKSGKPVRQAEPRPQEVS